MTGVCFSGGGARGIAHLGISKALKELKLKPDIYAGTSAGAIVGAFLAAGNQEEEALEVIQQTSLLSVFRPAFNWQGLLRMTTLESTLRKILPARFEDLKYPIIIAATDIEAGRIKYFDSGDLCKAILASCCVPVLFSPIVIDNRKYVDGGLLNNLPAEAIRDKTELLVGVSCNPNSYKSDLNNVRTLMERSSLLAISGNTEVSKSICDIIIEPQELSKFSGFDLSKASEIFEVGYRFTMENIDTFVRKQTKIK